MINAFKEMGPFGKIVVVLLVTASINNCVKHVAETVRQNRKAASGK